MLPLVATTSQGCATQLNLERNGCHRSGHREDQAQRGRGQACGDPRQQWGHSTPLHAALAVVRVRVYMVQARNSSRGDLRRRSLSRARSRFIRPSIRAARVRRTSHRRSGCLGADGNPGPHAPFPFVRGGLENERQ
jgi:hypothetical protein